MSDIVVVQQDKITTVQTQTVGPQGIQGIPGVNGDKTFTMPFTNSSSVAVPHNLGKYPAVTILSSAGDEVVGDVEYAGLNNLTVSFSASFSGTVVCN